MSNTNFQTFHQMGSAINSVVRQATGRDNVQNIDMDYVTVAQNKRLMEEIITGNPASFVTNIVGPLDYLMAKINPVQDLHGYENPWPAGGGKNLADFTDGYGINNDGSLGVSTKRSATLTPIKIESGKSYVVSSVSASFIYAVFNGETLVRRVAQVLSGSVLDTSDGTDLYVCGYSGSDIAVTAEGNKLMVEEGTTPSATYYPYSNICPISGWDSANVSRTGKNLLKNEIDDGTNRGITFAKNADGTVSVSGTNDGTVYSSRRITDGFQTIAGIEYTLSGGYSNTVFIRNITAGISSGDNPVTFTGDGTAHIFEIRVSKDYAISGTVIVKPMISIGNATEYEPYTGQTYPITFPVSAGTVYGGTLTVNKDGTGELVVDRAVVDLGTLAWQSWYETDSLIFNVSLPGKTQQRANPDCISSMYKYRSVVVLWSNLLNGEMTGNTANDRIYIRNNAYNNNESFKEGMNGIQLVYTLATPVTYQLTNQQVIETLKGVNNIWADTGDVTVMYKNYEEVI